MRDLSETRWQLACYLQCNARDGYDTSFLFFALA